MAAVQYGHHEQHSTQLDTDIGSTDPGLDFIEAVRERQTYSYLAALGLLARRLRLAAEHKNADPTLVALAQLTALKVQGARVFISLVDAEKQTFVAEAGPDTDLDDPNFEEDPWLGDRDGPRHGGICEHFMYAKKEPFKQSQCFFLGDLSVDERFRDLLFVAQKPHVRSYAAVPLLGDGNICIGSIFVLDSATRSDFPEKYRKNMMHMASLVVQRLEHLKAHAHYRRSENMIRSLGTYYRDGFPGMNDSVQHTSTLSEAVDSSVVVTKDKQSSQEHVSKLFDKASAVLLKSLDVDGVVFVDACVSSFGSHIQIASRKDSTSGSVPDEASQSSATSNSTATSLAKAPSGTSYAKSGSGASTLSSAFAQPLSDGSYRPAMLKDHFLQELMSRYPRGRIFQLTSEETAPEYVVAALQSVFPGARRIMFYPIWDFRHERWFAAGFAITSSVMRAAISQQDLDYLMCFGCGLMSEAARYDAVSAENAKTAFLASVSHELRSPLHGIMTSTELLRTDTASSEDIELLDTIDGSAKMLLGCIDQILDFAEVDRAIGIDKSEDAQFPQQGLQILRLSVAQQEQNREICSLMEQSLDTSVTSSAASLVSVQRGESVRPICILELDYELCGHQLTQAHAWNRIVANLFDNSLKFTATGFVRVELKKRTMDGNDMVVLSVQDSGRGMPQEFLQGNAFKPFSQAVKLSPGSGLGLSIVQRFVQAVGGQVHINSAEGHGTTVTVSVPAATSLMAEISHSSKQAILDIREMTKGKIVRLLGFGQSLRSESSPYESGHWGMVEESISSAASKWFDMDVKIADENSSGSCDVCVVLESQLQRLMGIEGVSKDELEEFNDKLCGVDAPVIVLTEGWSPGDYTGIKQTKSGQSFMLVKLPIGPHELGRCFKECFADAIDDKAEKETPDDIVSPSETLRQWIRRVSIAEKSRANSPHPPTQDHGDKTTNSSQDSLITKPRVLLVDDNQVNLKVLQKMANLSKLEYQSAVNGLQAAQIYEAEKGAFEVVFMDISMPVMNGIDSAKRIRRYEHEHNLKPSYIVAVTAVISEAARNDALGAGINRYLTKPVSMKKMQQVVSEWMASKQENGTEIDG